jgi:hypothetical protein
MKTGKFAGLKNRWHVGLTRKQVHEVRLIRDAEIASSGIVRRTGD